MYPWFSYLYPDPGVFYPDPGGVTKLGQGILYDPQNGTNKAAYMVVTNAPAPGVLSGFGIVRGSTNDWALPADHVLWSNYVFSCDFKETHARACILQLQLKDANLNWIEFNKTNAGPGRWDTIKGSLDQFVLPGPIATFDATHIREFVVNVQMLETNATYEAHFDNVQFVGPPNVQDDFQDRDAGADFSRIFPWQAYGYDEPNHNDVLLDKGVHLEASEGSQSAFVVAWNRSDSGNFAGFGMFRVFDRKWALPADTSQWKNYSFSFDFKEESGKQCVLELQLKNQDDPNCGQRGINFTKTYTNTPANDGWDTIAATVDQLTQPGYFCTFDPSNVFALVLNVQMTEKSPDTNVIYVASFDNIRFSGPETLAPGETTVAIYTSTNDFFGFRSIEPLAPGTVRLTWVGVGTLQWAETVDGTWTNITNATSPATLDVTTGHRFFRLLQ